jgi:hypothetical protein
MYKIIYTGRDYPEFIAEMINKERYKSKLEAETNKRITCSLLSIPAEEITIEKAEK